MIRPTVPLLALASLLLTGCLSPPRPVPALPETGLAELVSGTHGRTPAASALILLAITPAQGDGATASLELKVAKDGRVRATLTKAGYEALHLLVAPDGSCSAWAPRSRYTATGSVAEVGELGVVLEAAGELTEGPLPSRPPGLESPGEGRLTWRPGPRSLVELTVDGTGDAIRKRLITDGTEQVAIHYSRYRQIEDLRRAGRLELRLADGSRVVALVKELDPVPDIAPSGLRLDPPATAETTTLENLMSHLDAR